LDLARVAAINAAGQRKKERMKIKKIIGLTVMTLILVIITAATTIYITGQQWQEYSTSTYKHGYETGLDAGYDAAEKDAEGEYHRGAYDICMQKTPNRAVCNAVIQLIHKNNWYDKPSRGFEWPIADDKIKLRSG